MQSAAGIICRRGAATSKRSIHHVGLSPAEACDTFGTAIRLPKRETVRRRFQRGAGEPRAIPTNVANALRECGTGILHPYERETF